MGQASIKAGLEIQSRTRSVIDKFTFKFSSITNWKALTYDQFLHELELLNKVTDELTKESEKTVHFSLREGTEKRVFWKLSSKVMCQKVLRSNGDVLSTKLISVKRFMRLYSDMMHQVSAAAHASPNTTQSESSSSSSDMYASMIIDGLDNMSLTSDDNGDALNECCICMERECQTILPCTHGYCEECIHQWNETFTRRSNTRSTDTGSSCPLCRNPLADSSDHWVIPQPDQPTSHEIPALLMGLVDKADGRVRCGSGKERTNSRTSKDTDRPSSAVSNQTACTINGETAVQRPHMEESLVTTATPDGFLLVSQINPLE